MLGRKVKGMLPHSIPNYHLAPMIEQHLRRLDASALGGPMDGQLPERLVGNVDAGPGIEEDLDRLGPALQRRRFPVPWNPPISQGSADSSMRGSEPAVWTAPCCGHTSRPPKWERCLPRPRPWLPCIFCGGRAKIWFGSPWNRSRLDDIPNRWRGPSVHLSCRIGGICSARPPAGQRPWLLPVVSTSSPC